jgi:hypothetical protein
MPLEVLNCPKKKRSKVFAEAFETSLENGYCAAHKMYFHGYKLQGVCSVTGIFHSIALTKAHIYDGNFLT